MTICWARNSVSLWMARESIAFECGRKNIGLSRITKDEETQTSNKELNKLVARYSFLKEPRERNLLRTTIAADNNFVKWRGTFRYDRQKWPGLSQWRPPSKVVPNIAVGPNRNGPFHILISNWNFRNSGLNGKLPWFKLTTAPLSPADNYNNQTRGWLGSGLWNRNVPFHRAREKSEFSQAEFLLHGKCPWI